MFQSKITIGAGLALLLLLLASLAVSLDAATLPPTPTATRIPPTSDDTSPTPAANGPAPDFVLSLPFNTLLTTGRIITLTFPVKNDGKAAGDASLTFTLSDFKNESQRLSLAPGEAGRFDFSFYIPPERTARGYVATYVLSNTVTAEATQGELILAVTSLDLEVAAGLDKAVYTPGETAALTLDVTNRSVEIAGLYAVVRHGDYEDRQSFSLGGKGTQTLSFAVPAASRDDVVFYGIYDQATDRCIYFNTVPLYLANLPATLVTDRQTYQPGDTVHATVVTTATGMLRVEAPGYSQTLTLAGVDTGFSFTLPSPMAQGSYEIRYTLLDCDCTGEGRAGVYHFDVEGTKIQISRAALDRATYTPGDTIHLGLNVASNRTLPVILRSYVIYPNGSRSQPTDQAITLKAADNNSLTVAVPFATSQAGRHALAYSLLDPDDEKVWYRIATAEFDVRRITVIDIWTDEEVYLHTTQTVTVHIHAIAVTTSTVTLDLRLEGVSVQSQTVRVAEGAQIGYLPLTIPIAPGHHVLTAVLTADGMPSKPVSTSFQFGTQSADMTVSSLWLANDNSLSQTLTAVAANEGQEPAPATELILYDGIPGAGGEVIGQTGIPGLGPGEQFQSQVAWNVRGKGGTRSLFAQIDPANKVLEYREDNNFRETQVDPPHFILRAATTDSSYGEGKLVTLSASVENLMGSANLNGMLVTTVSYHDGDVRYDAFTDETPLTLSPGEVREVPIIWDTDQQMWGSYNVEYWFKDETGEERWTESAIELTAPIRANFEATPSTGVAPLNVIFTDLSTGGMLTRTWDFGDGATQILTGTTLPSHVYAVPGVYTVTLRVDSANESDTLVQSNCITAIVPPEAPIPAFSASRLTGTAPLTIAFYDMSMPRGWIDTWQWDFGDGSPAGTASNPSHVYIRPGIYTVTLTVTADLTPATAIKPNYVVVLPGAK